MDTIIYVQNLKNFERKSARRKYFSKSRFTDCKNMKLGK